MKGIVFTEFLEMVERNFSAEIGDDIIDGAELAHGGAYTSVGTYPHSELNRLVIQLSKRTSIPVPELLKTYGRHLFGRFLAGFPQFFENVHESFALLEQLDAFVHVEVHKLYRDAELPTFATTRVTPDHLRMVYQSPRCLGDFAHGLMEGAFAHFKEKVEITRTDMPGGSAVHFDLRRIRQ